jgi:hypothetical protein
MNSQFSLVEKIWLRLKSHHPEHPAKCFAPWTGANDRQILCVWFWILQNTLFEFLGHSLHEKRPSSNNKSNLFKNICHWFWRIWTLCRPFPLNILRSVCSPLQKLCLGRFIFFSLFETSLHPVTDHWQQSYVLQNDNIQLLPIPTFVDPGFSLRLPSFRCRIGNH